MRIALISAAALMLSGVAATAQEAAPAAPAVAAAAPAAPAAALEVRSGQIVRDANGKSLGRVNRVNKSDNGAVESVSVIVDGRFVRVAGATLSADGEALKTSLTKSEVRKQK